MNSSNTDQNASPAKPATPTQAVAPAAPPAGNARRVDEDFDATPAPENDASAASRPSPGAPTSPTRTSTSTSIFREGTTLDVLNALSAATAIAQLGIVFTELGADFVRATMPVDARTRQPYGLLHGGASVLLAETLGSTAGNLCVPTDRICVGLEINANHLRAVRDGQVTGTARPLHIGSRTQVWEIRLEDARGRLACISRLTLAVVDRPSAA